MQDLNHEHHNIMGMWVEGKQHDMKEEHRIIASFNITFPNISQIEKSKTSSQRKLLLLILKQKFSNNVSCCCSINFERYNLKVPTKQKKTGADLLSQPSCCNVSKFWSFHRQIKIQVCIGENDRQIDPDFTEGSFAYKKIPDYFPIDV